MRRLSIAAGLLVLALAGPVAAEPEQLVTSDHVLITAPIDDAVRVTLPGNTRPEAFGGPGIRDLGPVPADMMLAHVLILLRRAPDDDAAVSAFVDALHDPASPAYHRWLTPEEYGARFGLAPGDLGRIASWLESQGLTVNLVYPSRMLIDASGPAAAVGRAFGTAIHALSVNGVRHLANIADPSIPAALAGAVAGPVSLNDFRPIGQHAPAVRQASTAAQNEWVKPSDLHTIYGFTPVYKTGVTGAGQTIAVAEDSDMYAAADWSNFRRLGGLAGYPAGKLEVVHPAAVGGAPCVDPGTVGVDAEEATLDAEWSSAAAPGATILFAACAGSAMADGVRQAIANLVNGKPVPQIISVSYGICEAINGATGNAAFAQLYRQAAAEGISVFVASGDAGASLCAQYIGAGAPNSAQQGIGVSGWAATAYNVAVGGTDFADTYLRKTAAYWTGTASGFANARSYVPEIPWNDTCGSTLLTKINDYAVSFGADGFCKSGAGYLYDDYLLAGSGGPSGCATGAAVFTGVVGGTCKGTAKPGWQKGVVGVPADGVRDLPDVSLFAATGYAWYHQYVWCYSGNGDAECQGDATTWGAGGGGTSYSTPIMAGVQALVNQKTKEKWGNPNTVYYSLAAAELGASGNPACIATLGKSVGDTCVFHDIRLGDMDVFCYGGPDCYEGVLSKSTTADKPAYAAGLGYDLATGLGSVDVANLLANWPAKP